MDSVSNQDAFLRIVDTTGKGCTVPGRVITPFTCKVFSGRIKSGWTDSFGCYYKFRWVFPGFSNMQMTSPCHWRCTLPGRIISSSTDRVFSGKVKWDIRLPLWNSQNEFSVISGYLQGFKICKWVRTFVGGCTLFGRVITHPRDRAFSGTDKSWLSDSQSSTDIKVNKQNYEI